jgi:aryl-alcohol dehydrogenase-like predicted oxidoreductase
MEEINRRQFVGGTLAVTGAVALGALAEESAEAAAPRKPSDKVALGKSGIKVSLVGMGTGSVGWNHQSNQTRLGQEAFTHLVRYAYDQGIVFFDAADQYGSNPFLREALKGIPREKYVLQTKTNTREPDGVREDIDRFLKELGVDYIDSLIVHCVTEPDWTTRFRGVMDAMEEAKQKGKIRAHGVTCHSYAALEAAYASDWVQINQVRFNPKKAHMDNEVETCKALFARMRKKGQGMIGMKVVGQGDLLKDHPEYRNDCYRFQIKSGVVDAFVVGLEKREHVDQLIVGTQLALNEIPYRFASAL